MSEKTDNEVKQRKARRFGEPKTNILDRDNFHQWLRFEFDNEEAFL